MAKRFQIADHKIAYDFIAARDGEHCLICKRKPPNVKLQIDHADKNPDNNKPGNLHLLCQQHNLEGRKYTPREHLEWIKRYYAKNVSERECVSGIETTGMIQELVDYKTGTPEMQTTAYCEMQFREWLLAEIKRLKSIPKSEAINSGAEVVGCSPTTISRYLGKLTSAVGVLKETKDTFGTKVLEFKKK